MQTILNSLIQPLPEQADNAVPEWVHLLPNGSFTGADGRGPFQIDDPAGVIAASLKPGRKLPIDVNHAIDLVGKDGQHSPAVGWIVSLEARGDGIWGRVEWTRAGRQHLTDKDYGFLSPVFTHPKTGLKRVSQLLRAALTNDPNLTLTSLHHQHHGDREMEKAMREALGLPETATQDEILQAAKDRVAQLKTATEQMSRIAEAAGLKPGASESDIVTALNTRSKAKGDDAEKEALEAQITALNTRLTEVTTHAARKDAERVVDKAIEDGKVVPALRDRFIARHMKDAKEVEEEIRLMPSINAGGLGRRRPGDSEAPGLSESEAEVAQLMGLDPKKMAETAKTQKEAL